MALIICPECGKQVSDQANACPGCGFPIARADHNAEERQGMGNNTEKYYMLGHLVAVISCIVAAISTFLPFFTYHILGNEGSINLWHKSFIGLTIIGFILLAAELLELSLNKKSVARDTIILGILFIADISLQYAYNSKRLSNFETSFGKMDLSGVLQPGMGFYMIVIAGIGMIVAGVIMKMNNNSGE